MPTAQDASTALSDRNQQFRSLSAVEASWIFQMHSNAEQ